MKDVGTALHKLGYLVHPDVVFEILESLDLKQEEALTLDAFGEFLWTYRRAEGFTKQELEELDCAFRKFASDGISLNTLEFGQALRWFGFALPLQMKQKLIEDIDFDGSGRLEINEFRKVMRRLSQQKASERHNAFSVYDKDKTGRV